MTFDLRQCRTVCKQYELGSIGDIAFRLYARTALPAACDELEKMQNLYDLTVAKAADRLDTLLIENDRMRSAIRKHHGEVGDDRCKRDDDELYAAIGLGPPDRTLPPRCEFLEECGRFYDNRCDESARPSYRQLLDEVERLKKLLGMTDSAYRFTEDSGK